MVAENRCLHKNYSAVLQPHRKEAFFSLREKITLSPLWKIKSSHTLSCFFFFTRGAVMSWLIMNISKSAEDYTGLEARILPQERRGRGSA